MEGNGEGMVAIVQGLRDAGLAVTLIGRLQRRANGTAVKQSSQVVHAKSTVDAIPSALPPASVDTAAQICDDRYTSSYQLAHCRARTSSPPVIIAEFPPQRPEPCRTQGNFEIGGLRGGEAKSLVRTSMSQSRFINSFSSVDRGVLSNSRTSRGTEAFACSLRKYPSLSPYRSISPNRSISTELVQRLLAYTQAKNFSKSSYHCKSVRSFRNKTESPKQMPPKTKSSKSVQTYTRIKVKERPIPEGEEKENVREQKKKRAQSPVKSGRDVRYKDGHINTTYDYLKSTSPRRFSRMTDVRYLNDVTRCLRDTLRQIYDDQAVGVFQMCPNIQDRYSRHRREHHARPGRSPREDSNNTEDQESQPMVSTEVPAMPSCAKAIQRTCQHTCPSRPKLCCYCHRPLPCSCSQRSSVQFQRVPKVISNDSCEDSNVFATISLSEDESSCICCNSLLDDFEKDLKEQVYNWLQEVPVYAYDKPEDRRIRENMAKNLIDKLKGMKDDEAFEEKAKAEIAECIRKMPMWCPGNKENQEFFKQQIADNLLNKVLDVSKQVDKFEKEISKWVDSLNLKSQDSQGQIIDKQSVVENLVNRLKPLVLNQTAYTEEYKEDLKKEIVDILYELPIQIDGDKKTFIDNIAEKLATQLNTIPAKYISKRSSVESLENQFQKQIWEWLEDVPKFSSPTASKIEENQKSVKLLANKLQKLQAQGIDDIDVQEQMQNEINEWLETNVGETSRLDPKTKNKLTQKLLGNLINTSKIAANKRAKKPLSENKITQQILDWVNDIPELSGGDKMENQKMVEQLAKKLFELQSIGKDDRELEDEISNWLTRSIENKGGRLDARNQSNLVKNLLSTIKTSTEEKGDQLMQDIKNCFEDIPELDMTSEENKKMVEQLANKIQELQSLKPGYANEDDMKEEIANWLDDLTKDTGAKINPITRNGLMQKLINIAQSSPKQRKRWSKQYNLQQAISDEISSILEGSSCKLSNGNKKDVQNKISNFLSRKIDKVESGDESGEIKSKIVDILKQDFQIPTSKGNKVAEDIINAVQNMTLPEPNISVQSDHLKNTIREEVSHILDESNFNDDNREQIEAILTDVLADQIMRGENDEQTENRLMSSLQNSDNSKDQTKEIASKLMSVGKKYYLGHKSINSTTRFGSFSNSKEFEALSPMQKEMFLHSAEQEIVEFIEEITGDGSIQSVKKYKAAAEKLAQKVDDLMSDKDTTIADKREGIESEVSKCLQSLSISTDASKVKQLADSLQNFAFMTSTPRRASKFSFRPRRDSTMSTIEDASQYTMQSPTPEKKQYMDKLVKRIDRWMTDLPIDLDTEDGRSFKGVMIKDLAGDIIDRQKYLQLNPDVKTSDKEELEHLKYQVFRWLNKLPYVQPDDLMPAMAKTDYLMEQIKAVDVPQLVKTMDRRFSQQKHSYNQRLSQDLSSLQNEISKWIEAVPSKFYATSEEGYHQRMVKELAQKIDQLHSEGELTEALLDDVVSKWLQKMLKEYNDQYFGSLTEGLKGVLLNKGLISFPTAHSLEKSMLARENSLDIQENLRSSVLDWLKETSLYQQRLSIEKREQEQIVAELSKNLKDALRVSHPSESQRDKRVLDEIKSHIKKFPMDSKLKLDDNFHHSTANDLLEYLKTLQILQNVSRQSQSVSQRQSLSPSQAVGVEDILPVLEEWMSSLPLKIRKTSFENKKLDDVKQNLAETVQKIKQQHPLPCERASRVLKEEIENYLHKFPIEPAKKKDEQFLSDKINELHNMLLVKQSPMTRSNGRPSRNIDGVEEILPKSSERPSRSVAEVEEILPRSSYRPSRSVEGVEEILPVLEEWIDSLPLQVSKTSAENKKLDNLIQEFAQTVQQINQQYPVPNARASKCLQDEIKNNLQKLPIEPAKKKDEQFVSDKIDELHDKLLAVQSLMTRSNGRPSRSVEGVEEILPRSSERPSRSVAGVEEILPVLEEWIDSLPLQVSKTSAENKKLDNLIQEFAQTVQQINQQYPVPNARASKCLQDEIKNNLQKLPIEPAKKKDEQFVSDKIDELHDKLLAVQLLMTISNSRPSRSVEGVEEILPRSSERPSRSVAGVKEILPVLEEWIDSLPLQVRKTPVENKKLDNLIQEFAQTVQQINQQYPVRNARASKCLQDEIKSNLQKLPIEPAKKKDEQFVSDKIDELHDKLLAVQSLMTRSNGRPSRSVEGVEEILPRSSERPSRSVAGVEKILPVLEEWIDSLPLQVSKTPVANKKLDNLIQEFAQTVQQINQQYPGPNARANKFLKEKIKNYLQKLPIEPAKTKDEQFVSGKIEELHNKLLAVQAQMTKSNERPSISVESVKEAIRNWAKKLPFQAGKSIEKPEVDKLASKIKDMVSNMPLDGENKVKDNLEKKIKAFVNTLPLNKNKLKDDHIKELTYQLHDFVKPVTCHSMATDSSINSKSGPKKAADVLYDNIVDWCENLPIQSENTPEEKERVKTLKQNIVSKLINTIGDLNVNPEIFNDDLLYDDLLNDRIDDLLNTLPPSPELEQQLPALKENLIEKVKEAKLQTQDELAGQAYKQQLYDSISKTLPSIDNLSIEEQAPFEVLKDNLADAYINFHHASGDEETKSKLKSKIRTEIDQFCNEYLKRYPATPVDPIKLNRELYKVLQKVPAPKDETIKTQVEQIRIKDEINDWLQEIPLIEDLSPTEQIKTNKIVNLLAKRLHNIEKEKEYNPEIDVEDRMKKEIRKWVNKLPIRPGDEDKVEEMVEQLTAKLRSTEESRRFSVSNIRHLIDTPDDQVTYKSHCPFYFKPDRPAMPLYQPTPPNSNRFLSQYAPPFPPSALSTEDRAHLERIRERNRAKQLSFMPASPPCQCKDASVNPIPIDAGSQTDVGPGASARRAMKSMQPQTSPCNGGQAAPIQSSDSVPSSQIPVSPQVVVKEFFWDSPDNAPTMRDPGYASLCGQQGQSARFRSLNQPSGLHSPSVSHQGSYQNQPCGQQFSWPQSQVNQPPRFGVPQQPSPCSGSQGQFPLPDQSSMPQSPCMMSPPAMTMQPPFMQQPVPPQSRCISPIPQMLSQAPCMSMPQTRHGQSPCMSQESSMVPQASGMQRPYPSAPPYPSSPPCMGPQSPSTPPQSPCMMSKQSLPSQMRPPYLNQPQMPEPRFSYMPQYNKSPCMSTPQMSQPQMPPCQSQETPRQRAQPSRHSPCHSQETAHRETRKPFRQPWFGSPEVSSTSSPFDTGPDDISRFGPKVTHLGSFDDVPCTKTCGSQSPRSKRSRGCPVEDYDWTIRFPEDEGFWGTPCARRRTHKSQIRSSGEAFIKEKERKEEKMRCRCRERVLTKCVRRRPQTCSHSCQLDDDLMEHCSKCCGAHCPHPNYLFFK